MEPEQLGFTPRRAVPWLSPVLLAGTAVRVVLAELFGAYLDKRELQNALPAKIFDERPDGDDNAELWLDYVADLGDGFNPTYSVAYLLAQSELTVEGRSLPRGRLIVMGGDQVYPTASSQQYEDRFKGPYEAALPAPPPTGARPSIYALPGNHDWYDGLTAFIRLFTREGARVGGWQTRQTRSYFAVELPHRWWLLAIDAQLGAYIDDPQLRYFKDAVKSLQPGDRVIVCAPNPSWVEGQQDPHAYDTLDYFVRNVVMPTGAMVRLMLSGDLHHYAHYSGPDRELITCGGGGAYLYPTHRLPEEIQVPPRSTLVRTSSVSEKYQLGGRTFPSKTTSRRLAASVFARLPWCNPGFVSFLGVIHLLLMLAVAGAIPQTSAANQRLFSIPLIVMSVLVLGGNIAFAMPPTAGRRRLKHWILGGVHGAAHIGLGVLGALAWLALPFHDLPWPLPLLVAALLYLPASGLVSSQLVSLYLLVASVFDTNVNELFAAQGIIDHKSFLRLHFTSDGALTIYPIAIDRVGRRWQPAPQAARYRPWLEPDEPIRTHFAEPPITIR
jgi:hypothetical protein